MKSLSSSSPSFFRLAGKTIKFWVGGILLLVGIPFLVMGTFFSTTEARREDLLSSEGTQTVARILNRRTVQRDKSTQYWVDFQFVTGSGQQIEDSAQVGRDVWSSVAAEAGGEMEVTYLPSDPSVHRLTGEKDMWVLAYVFSILGAGLTVAGGILFWLALQSIFLFQRLFREGMPTSAEIIEVNPTSVRINRVRQWRIRYRYNDSMGGQHEGRSPYLSPQEASAWKVGDRSEVRFDPRKPELSIWIASH